MTSKPRVHFPGALYHATCLPRRQVSRGNQGRLILRDEDEREHQLAILKGCRPNSAANFTLTCREISRIRWIIAKIGVEEAGYRLMEVARYLNRDAGVMSHGLRWLEHRVQVDRTFHKRIGTAQAGIRKGRKPKIAKR